MDHSHPTTGHRSTLSDQSKEENVWASLPPLNTIKPEELIRYQIVDWDYNNPHHPRYLEGHILIKSLFTKNHYYWIACSNPLPKQNNKTAAPAITFSPPSSSTPELSRTVAQPPGPLGMSESSFARNVNTRQGAAVTTSFTAVLPTGSAFVKKNTSTMNTSAMNTSAMITSAINTNSISFASSQSRNVHPSPPHAQALFNLSFQPLQPNQNTYSTPYPTTPTPQVTTYYPGPNSSPPSSPVSSSTVSASQKKRAMKSKQQEGRNVRPEPVRGPLNTDGKSLAGVEKPADRWLNLGTMAWHYRGPGGDVGGSEKP